MAQEMSRRSFVLGSLGVGAAAGAMAFGPGAALADEAAAPEEYDYEADFVVVGSGTGALGAYAATCNGGTAIVLEKGTFFGGTTRLSGGNGWVGNNKWCREGGFGEDSEEKTLAYMQAADAFGDADGFVKKSV